MKYSDVKVRINNLTLMVMADLFGFSGLDAYFVNLPTIGEQVKSLVLVVIKNNIARDFYRGTIRY